jgi:parallel beta-helix repeat protein
MIKKKHENKGVFVIMISLLILGILAAGSFLGIFSGKRGISGNVVLTMALQDGNCTENIPTSVETLYIDTILNYTKSNKCIKINSPNVMIECRNNGGINISSTSNDTIGIYVNQSNVTIKNCYIEIDSSEIPCEGAPLATMDSCLSPPVTVTYGVYLAYSNTNSNARNSILANNVLKGNSYGVYALNVSNVNLNNNRFEKNNWGLYLNKIANSTFISNTFVENSESAIYGVNLGAENLFEFNYLSNSAAGIFLNKAINNSFYNNTLSSSSRGFYIQYTNNSLFYGNKIFKSSLEGMFLANSNNNSLISNELANNTRALVLFGASNYNNVSYNIFSGNRQNITNFSSSSNNSFSNNVFLPLEALPLPSLPLLTDSVSGALFLNGSGQYGKRTALNSGNSISRKLSLSIWIKQNGTKNENMSVFSLFGADNVGVYVKANSTDYYYTFKANGTNANAPLLKKEGLIGTLGSGWHNIVFVYDYINLSIYIDGAKKISESFQANVNGDIFSRKIYKKDNSIYIGGKGDNSSFTAGSGFRGFVDHFFIFNESLSAGEITKINNKGRNADDCYLPDDKDSLIAWHAFNDGSGSTAKDILGMGNDLSLVGNPQWVIGPSGEYNGEDRSYDPNLGIFYVSLNQLNNGYSTSLPLGDEIGLNISGEIVSLAFDDYNATTKKALFLIDEDIDFYLYSGNETKFDFDDDGYYDFLFRLNRVSLSNIAHIYMKLINEQINVEGNGGGGGNGNGGNNNKQGDKTGGSDNKKESVLSTGDDGVKSGYGNEEDDKSPIPNHILILVISIIVLLIIIIIVWIFLEFGHGKQRSTIGTFPSFDASKRPRVPF